MQLGAGGGVEEERGRRIGCTTEGGPGCANWEMEEEGLKGKKGSTSTDIHAGLKGIG